VIEFPHIFLSSSAPCWADVEQLKFKHPIEKHEDALKSRIAALDRHFAKGGMKLSPKRHTREVLQCTLEQCIDFRTTSTAYINSLELAIEKYHQKISDVKNGIITWSRYVFIPSPPPNSHLQTRA
jgi:hypothetical protein